jgi:hypothetical protein
MNRLQKAFALALFTAFVSMPAATQADAIFNRDQNMRVRATGWVFVGVWSYSSSNWRDTTFGNGDFDYDYTLLLNDWAGHFLYDFDTGGWTQSVFMTRQNL